MPLKIHNHRTRTKHPFIPLQQGKAGLYVCGLTVQDRPHLGHFYAFVACDMIRRYLEHLGYTVTHVQNFTDIDDKIIDRANRENTTPKAIAQQHINAYHKAANALNILPAHHYPKVTDHIPEIITLTQNLITNNHAYQSNGDVYFRVRSDSNYGTLSGRDLDDMRTGVRIEVGSKKQDPLDFALWKSSLPNEPGWDSPWGRGRPGWHIECSAMATRYLGNHFDFHGGGRDLLFPHHENELAQSCCATGQDYVNHWLHSGLLYLGKSKMSKSDGNFLAIDDLIERHTPEVLRFFLLNAHFRSHLDFSEDLLKASATGFNRLKRGAQRLLKATNPNKSENPLPRGLLSVPGATLTEAVTSHHRRFFAAMDDDFNSGGAIGELFGLVRDLNQYFTATAGRGLDPQPLQEARALLAEADQILGLFSGGLQSFAPSTKEPPQEILDLMERREEARSGRDWAEADDLRLQIQNSGWQIVDTEHGSRLEPLATDK